MISVRQFDTIKAGDVVTREGLQLVVEQVHRSTVDGGEKVNTVVFDDGTCITRSDGIFLLRAFHFPRCIF